MRPPYLLFCRLTSCLLDWAPDVGFEGKIQQGHNLVDAAKATGIQHFIWALDKSSSPDQPSSRGRGEADVNSYLLQSGVPRTSYVESNYLLLLVPL